MPSPCLSHLNCATGLELASAGEHQAGQLTCPGSCRCGESGASGRKLYDGAGQGLEAVTGVEWTRDAAAGVGREGKAGEADKGAAWGGHRTSSR